MPPSTHVSGLDDLYGREGFVAGRCDSLVAGITLARMRLQAQLHRAKADLGRQPADDPNVKAAREHVDAVSDRLGGRVDHPPAWRGSYSETDRN